jgi:hypothetical protein
MTSCTIFSSAAADHSWSARLVECELYHTKPYAAIGAFCRSCSPVAGAP